MRLAHLSDLHTGISAEHDRRIAGLVAEVASAGVEHLLITGDLTQAGQDHEFKTMAAILKQHDFLTAPRLTVIPGNHDLFHAFFDFFSSRPKTLRRFYALPVVMSEMLRSDRDTYRQALARFTAHFAESFANVTQLDESEGSAYPFIKVLADEIAVIGLETNECLGLLENPSRSNGSLQVAGMKKILSHPGLQNKLKLVLLHNYLHPPEEVIRSEGRRFEKFTRLYHRDAAVEALCEFKVALALHGHWHVNREYRLADGRLRCLNGGASCFGYWNLLEIRGGNIEITPQYCRSFG